MRWTGLFFTVAVSLPCIALGSDEIQDAESVTLDVDSTRPLSIPELSDGPPAAGRRVKVTPPAYAGTEVFHTLYLPPFWKPSGRKLPIIFEYTGNDSPASGSTGKVEDAGLGYGLSGGKYIWVSLPYISRDRTQNEVTWWGDTAATVEYAKVNVSRIIKEFGADPTAVFLCGFSRGAIAVNYIGLHDDQIANLWTAFVTHDHFDGVKEWRRTEWGSPLDKYRVEAAARLKRVAGRPYLVCQNGKGYGTEAFVRSVLSTRDNFTFCNVDTRAIFGSFPNEAAKAPHTDRWLVKPSSCRQTVWRWMNAAASH